MEELLEDGLPPEFEFGRCDKCGTIAYGALLQYRPFLCEVCKGLPQPPPGYDWRYDPCYDNPLDECGPYWSPG